MNDSSGETKILRYYKRSSSTSLTDRHTRIKQFNINIGAEVGKNNLSTPSALNML